MVRAKFKVDSVTHGNDSSAVYLSPVYGNDDPEHENTKFYKWTPGGQISLQVVRRETAERFELGKEYYVDFTPAS